MRQLTGECGVVGASAMEVKDVFDFMNMEDGQREKLLASLTQAQLRVRGC